MKRIAAVVILLGVGVLLAGCATPSRHISDLRLGMTPDEVRDAMGDPFAIRAAKVYENEETSEIWEYIPPVFSIAGFADRYDKEYRLVFENGRLVQWGEPGDLSYDSSLSRDQEFPVQEYSPRKRVD